MPFITIAFQIDAEYYPDGADGYVTMYIPRSLSDSKYNDPEVAMVTGRRYDIRLWVPSSMPSNMPIMIRWTVKRTLLGDKHIDGYAAPSSSSSKSSSTQPQVYYALAAFVNPEINQLEDVRSHVMKDIQGTSVGTIKMVAVSIEGGVILSPPLQSYINDNTTRAERMAKVTEKSLSSKMNGTNITYLPPSFFDAYPTPIGTIPRWAFVREVERPIDDPVKYNRCFEGLLKIAKLSMGYLDRADIPIDTKCELMCNMFLAPTRHLMYVTDSSRRQYDDTPTDEWEHLGHSGRGELEGFDCEDGASQTIELIYNFINMPSKAIKDPLLLELHTIAQGYMPLFCIGSIRLGSGYTYHAFVLLMDKNRLKTPPTATTALPTCLLESTNYSTSCWEYKDGKQTQKEYEAKHLKQPIEAITFVPNNLMKSIYMHLCVAYSPTLMKLGIARLDFTQGGRYGVSILDIMQGNTYNVIETSLPEDTNFYDYMQRSGSLFVNDNVGIDPESWADLATTKPDYDLCYRAVDWSSKLYSDIRSQTKASKTQVIHINLPANQKGVRVRCWI